MSKSSGVYYRSFDDLNNLIRSSVEQLPADLDLVVGVPRSGLLVANLLALHLHLPLTDIEGLINGRLINAGPRLINGSDKRPCRRVLVVDDSISSGEQLLEVREKLNGVDAELLYAVAYAEPQTVTMVDYAFEVVPQPRFFEWNINGPILKRSCVDIDGVLCRDPTDAENDDGPAYVQFLETVSARVRPRHKIAHLVTSRLERYRSETETWLRRAGIQYDKLWMSPFQSAEERRRAGTYAALKAEVYAQTGSDLFIESSPPVAQQIAEISQRPVFCYETRRMLYPGKPPQALMTFPGPKPSGVSVPLSWFIRQLAWEVAFRARSRLRTTLRRMAHAG